MASSDGRQTPTAYTSADGGDARGGLGQLSLFVLGSALLLVGVAVLMGVQLGGLLAPEQPAGEVTDTTSATAATSQDGGGRGGGGGRATATSVATPTNASNATATTPPPSWTATPTTISSPTPSPTPTPTASPTETDDGIVIDDPGDGRGSMSDGRKR